MAKHGRSYNLATLDFTNCQPVALKGAGQMDDATSEHTSMLFCPEEGIDSSFHGIGQTIARYGLFCSLYTDRGSHYFHTPEAGNWSIRCT